MNSFSTEPKQVVVRIEGDESGLLVRDLFEAISDDPGLRNSAEATLVEEPAKPGEMSGAVATAIVIVPMILAVPGFVAPLLTFCDWFARRSRPTPTITMTVGEATITMTDPEVAARLCAALQATPDRDHADDREQEDGEDE